MDVQSHIVTAPPRAGLFFAPHASECDKFLSCGLAMGG
jgi:hypothetical protein